MIIRSKKSLMRKINQIKKDLLQKDKNRIKRSILSLSGSLIGQEFLSDRLELVNIAYGDKNASNNFEKRLQVVLLRIQSKLNTIRV